jgi:hypothetical protein
MKKFLVLYLIPPSVMDEWMKKPAEARKSEEEKVSGDMQKWMVRHSGLFTDRGAGLGKTLRVTQGGTSEARNALVMYAIIHGDSREAVATEFQDHPHLQIPEASIEVMELFAMPN